jgi:hypothetical protein
LDSYALGGGEDARDKGRAGHKLASLQVSAVDTMEAEEQARRCVEGVEGNGGRFEGGHDDNTNGHP